MPISRKKANTSSNNPPPVTGSSIGTIRYWHWIMLSTLGLFWGSSFFVNAQIVEHLPPIITVFIRLAIGALIINVIVFARRVPNRQTRPRWQLSLVSALTMNVIPFLLIVWAQQYVASGVAGIVNAFTPITALLVAQIVAPEDAFSWKRFMAIALGIAGVTILIGWEGLAGDSTLILPMFSILAATFCYGTGATVIYRWRRTSDSTLLICRDQFTISTILMLSLVIFESPDWIQTFLSQPALWFYAIWIGGISTALAYLLFYTIIKQIGPTNASLVTFIVPIVSIMLGVTFRDEIISINHSLGLLLILSALYATHRLQIRNT